MSNQVKKPSPVTIGDYVLDASITETHTFESDVTEYPVEQGSAISDNIRPKPITVTIEGIVSDTPIGRMVDVRNGSGDPSGSMNYLPSVDALTALIAIRDARQPVPISTSLQRFENMAMTNLEIPRDAQTGAALRFSATFQQITIVTNQRVTLRTTQVRTATPGGQPKKNKGKWATQTGVPGIYVITFPVAGRAAATKSLGPPILTDSYGDHYKVDDKTDTAPDGYIGSDNKYHPLTVTGFSSTPVKQTLNGRPVHFDYGTKNPDGTLVHSGGTWVDDRNNQVVKVVPPGADMWQGVIQSNRPPGL